MGNTPPIRLDDVIIRSAQRKDADAIGLLWEKLVDYHQIIDAAMPRASRGGATHYARRIREQIDENFSHVIVAEHNGQIVGFVVGVIVDLTPEVFQPETNGFLADIYIEESYRSGGLGRRIVDALIAWFQSRGVLHMEWYVAAQNNAGRAFWQTIGGREVMIRMRLDL